MMPKCSEHSFNPYNLPQIILSRFRQRLSHLKSGVLLMGVLVLAACGGGGNGGGGNGGGDNGGGGDGGSNTDNGDPAIKFNKAKGFNGPVDVILPLNDGSGATYFAGEFTAYNDISTKRIIRINQDGNVDTSFNPGSGFNARITKMIHTSDGSGDIYVAGLFTTYQGQVAKNLVRLNSDGSIDADFSVGDGFEALFNTVFIRFGLQIALANDGTEDLYVGGPFEKYNGTIARGIVRLDSDGSIDATFDSGEGIGLLRSSSSSIDYDSAIVPVISVPSDGSGDVYIVGTFNVYKEAPVPNIFRLNSDGSVDTNFNAGSAFNDSADAEVNTIEIANDGSEDIYVGGSFSRFNGADTTSILRLNNDGSLDTGFGTGSGLNGDVNTIVVTNDGSGDIYASGSFDTYRANPVSYLVRINSDGSNDGNFSTAAGFNSIIDTLALSTNGSAQIYISGNELALYGEKGFNFAARLDTDAALDTSFNVGAGFNGPVSDASPSRDGTGDIYACGLFTHYDGKLIGNVARLNGNGTLDENFLNPEVVGSNINVCKASKDGTGKLYVASEPQGLRRLEADGSLDTSFSSALDAAAGRIYDIYLPNDNGGKLYIGGRLLFNGIDYVVLRMNANGTIDEGFMPRDNNGDEPFGFDLAVKISPVLDNTNDIYVLTLLGNILRLDESGLVQEGFDIGSGFGTSALGLVTDIASALDGSGNVYAVGEFQQYREAATFDNILIRFNGLRDVGFAIDKSRRLGDVIPLEDGSEDSIVLGGSVARLNRQGSVSATGFEYSTNVFGRFGTFTESFFAEDGSGDIFAVGDTISYNNQVVNNIIRISSMGELR